MAEDAPAEDDAHSSSDGLPVPFGDPDAGPLAEHLPPTPPSDDPALSPDTDGATASAETDAPLDADEPAEDEDLDVDLPSAGTDAGPEPGVEAAEPRDADEPPPSEPPPSLSGAPPPAVEMRHGVPVERVAPAEPAGGSSDVPPLGATGRPAAGLTPGSLAGLDKVAEGGPLPGWKADLHRDTETARTPQRRPWWVWALVLLAAVLLFVLLMVWWSRSTQDEPIDIEPMPEPAAVVVDPDATADPPPTDSASAVDPDAAPATDDPAPTEAAPAEPAPTPNRPERLAGLPDADVRALAGGTVDPADGGWTLVVFASRTPGPAEAEAARYQEAGYRAGVVPSESGGRTWHRTAIGQFASEADAARLIDRLPPRAAAEAWAAPLRTP